MSQTVDYTSLLYQRDGYVVSYCPELNVGSFGDDADAARASLREAVECFVEGCRELGTLEEVLEEAGYSVAPAPQPRWKHPPLLQAEEMEVLVA